MTRHSSLSSRLSSLAHVGLAGVLAVGALRRDGVQQEARGAGGARGRKGRRSRREGREKIGAAAEKAGEKIGAAAEKLGDKLGPASEDAAKSARDAAAKGAAVAAAAGAEGLTTAAGVLRTGAVKAALLHDSSIDVSDVDVDTNEVARRVTLKGRVQSAAVRDKVVDLAREAAPGYTIDNELTIR